MSGPALVKPPYGAVREEAWATLPAASNFVGTASSFAGRPGAGYVNVPSLIKRVPLPAARWLKHSGGEVT